MTRWGRDIHNPLENVATLSATQSTRTPHWHCHSHFEINRYIPISSRTCAGTSSLLTLALIKLLMAAKMPISFWKGNSLCAHNSFTGQVCQSIQTSCCAFHLTLSIYADTWMKLTDQVCENRVGLLK